MLLENLKKNFNEYETYEKMEKRKEKNITTRINK